MKAAGVGVKALLLALQFVFLRCGLSLNLGFIDFTCLHWSASSRDLIVFVSLALGL